VQGLISPDPAARRGVALGLREVLASAHKSHIGAYMGALIPAVRDALCDPSPVSAARPLANGPAS
jgi:hypothetical protein